eukprot:8588-Eustigmatos_ZCMA.PRE.1
MPRTRCDNENDYQYVRRAFQQLAVEAAWVLATDWSTSSALTEPDLVRGDEESNKLQLCKHR